jgi:hypothetical protein
MSLRPVRELSLASREAGLLHWRKRTYTVFAYSEVIFFEQHPDQTLPVLHAPVHAPCKARIPHAAAPATIPASQPECMRPL